MLSSGSPPVLGDDYISQRFYSGRTQVQVVDVQRERRIVRWVKRLPDTVGIQCRGANA